MNRRQFLELPAALPAAGALTLTTPTGETFDVQVLRLKAGDRLVLTTPHAISHDTAERVRTFLEHHLAALNVTAMVLSDGMKIAGVLRGDA